MSQDALPKSSGQYDKVEDCELVYAVAQTHADGSNAGYVVYGSVTGATGAVEGAYIDLMLARSLSGRRRPSYPVDAVEVPVMSLPLDDREALAVDGPVHISAPWRPPFVGDRHLIPVD